MSIVDEFSDLVSSHLETLNKEFESELVNFIKFQSNKDVKFFEIEYDSQNFDYHFSVSIFGMNKVGEDLIDHFFLEDKAVVVPKDIFNNEKFQEIEKEKIVSDILKSWLINRWKNVGNNEYPTFLAHHDSYFMRNINDGTEINWDQILDLFKDK
ncbi:hypothetical protein [Leptospira terpstrae]|uniref:Uncharacterized protein n=1 Tax=Leptospira terpstrae serovar Hualin str. LT 11-33 = ATCC 700639 TaxID=1257025 RepID=N1W7A7_9LEPT|nr:hypothetical protein [Leptospira terpstrae]EMY63546.1 hypothetical protein LEP1GSC203_0405 [Leptospira terpstrae serovar Hualin str. LT 11-33 = ATCC 700639]